MPDVDSYIKSKKETSSGKVSEIWCTFDELYERKLWHELTVELQLQIKNVEFTSGLDLVEFNENFISDFEHRINPVSLVTIAAQIAASMKDPSRAVQFLEKKMEVIKASGEATVLCLAYVTEQELRRRDPNGQTVEINKVKEVLDKAQEKLDTLTGISLVHGEFYRVSSLYFRDVGNFAAYYREALRYLGCIDVNTLLHDEQIQQAVCLALAALLGENVYNFGELLAHPILMTLKGTENEWLVELLYVFNSGNFAKFQQLRNKWEQQADLKKNEKKLAQKIQLMALMELSFARPPNKRQLRFDEIQAVTGVGSDEVEFLVMKTLAAGIVRGYIDQVDSVVNITWVQPRVLDKDQLRNMAERIKGWCRDVSSISSLVQNEAEEILTH